MKWVWEGSGTVGLAFSHCKASWAYSGFHSFRMRLAAEIGVYLPAMEGFCTGSASHTSGFSGDVRPIPWEKVDDPIVPLLNHSDSGGFLTPGECMAIRGRMRYLISRWDEDDYDRIHGQMLAEGMDKAIELGEMLEFR